MQEKANDEKALEEVPLEKSLPSKPKQIMLQQRVVSFLNLTIERVFFVFQFCFVSY